MTRGRPREFDKVKALNAIMRMFWQRGYHAVRLDDIAIGLDITKPSLYAAFGDKESLFLHAVEHYKSTVILPVLRGFVTCKDLPSGLESFLRAYGSRVTQKDMSGCLITCVMPQIAEESPAAKRSLNEFIGHMDSSCALVLSKRGDQLRNDVTPRDGAMLIMSSCYGMSIRARAGASARSLEPVISLTVQAICDTSS